MLAPIVYYPYAVCAYAVVILVWLYRAIIGGRCVCCAPFPKIIIKRAYALTDCTSIICLWSSSASFFLCIHGYAPFQPLKIGGYLCFRFLCVFSLLPVKVLQSGYVLQYIDGAAVRQAKADARYIIYYIYNIYSFRGKVWKSLILQGFAACFWPFLSARFSGVICPFFGGVPPKIRG